MDDNLILGDPRPSRADALKNRLHLLETAKRLFDEQGADTVTMSAVAEAAGVGKGTLYRHFPNGKGDLCRALLDECQRDLQNRTLSYLRTGGDPENQLVWFLEQIVLFVEDHRPLLVMVDGVPDLAHPAHWWWMQTIRGLLGQIRPDLDLDYAADVLYVMVDPRTVEFQRTRRGYSLERVLTGLTEVVRRLITG
ncbi:MAG: TetR/AcrR family transcriptional regulator [Anaerolinea sp.]|nr:TetR/AcrR family transcriptional regulator [Anaerolinea sp.]